MNRLLNELIGEEIGHVELLVLLAIADHVNGGGGTVFPSVPRLSKLTHLTTRTVRRSLKRLEDSGRITVERRDGLPSLYQVSTSAGDAPVSESHPCKIDTPDRESPLTESQGTPDTESLVPLTESHPNLPLTYQEPTNSPHRKKRKKDPTPYDDIMTFWNEQVAASGEVPRIRGKEMSDVRKRRVKKMVDSHGAEEVYEMMRKIPKSDFLSGRKKDWRCNFDWVFLPSNFDKILEGNYDNPTTQEPEYFQ